MAKNVISKPKPDHLAKVLCTIAGPVPASDVPLPEYDLVGDIIFDPPLSAEELQQRYGLGMTMEERIKRARRHDCEEQEPASSVPTSGITTKP